MVGFSSIDEVWTDNNYVIEKKETRKEPKANNMAMQERKEIPVMDNKREIQNININVSDKNVVNELSRFSKSEQSSYIQKLVMNDINKTSSSSFGPDVTDIDLFMKIFIALVLFEFVKSLLFPSQSST